MSDDALKELAAEIAATGVQLKPTKDDNDAWGGYDWGKASLAVVAMGERGGCVLWTVGAHVEFDMIETGLGPGLEDLGIEPDDEGIFVWEGRTRSKRSYEGEVDTWLEGDFRPPTEDEWACIRRGECPWDNAKWMKAVTP